MAESFHSYLARILGTYGRIGIFQMDQNTSHETWLQYGTAGRLK
jgi:hypothetical protein